MKKDLTELVFILDKSGSMSGLEKDTIGGFNSLIEKQKNESGEAIVSTVLFSDKMDVIHDRIDIKDVPKLTSKEYFVSGCTALLDTVGFSINHIKHVQENLSDDEKPEKTLFIITTDGMENSSHEFNYQKIKKLIDEVKEKDKYDFAYALNDQSTIDSYRELFDEIWNNAGSVEDVKEELLKYISNLYKENSPELAYYITLYNLFNEKIINEEDYENIKEATGITQTKVWSMLYNFQQDAVVGAIHKIQKYDGCIIADSVGLGKTFEALAIIKYYELRNERVLVLCPKKLRSNWTGFKQNEVTNPLVDDKFRYDVLNHTDLSRTQGKTGDIDLTKINWGNYDLVVIDESHAFRNNPARNDRITRYSRLMDSIIKSGVKTKVLMLSATPVNNRLSDLKNQLYFITAGEDDAMVKKGKKNVQSIEGTLTKAQGVFNKFAKKDTKDDKILGPSPEVKSLIDSLDYDFFDVLDTYTIARSRKHIQKYYDISDIGKFPERLKPKSVYCKVDKNDKFPAVSYMNEQILMLNLCIYSPLTYVLPTKKEEYENKYKTFVRGGKSVFSQLDREKNLVNLMRINILKRLESGVNSFKLTVDRILAQVNNFLDMIDGSGSTGDYVPSWDDDEDDEEVQEILDDEMEIGGKIKVKLKDMIKQVDDNAFVAVSDVSDVMGGKNRKKNIH